VSEQRAIEVTDEVPADLAATIASSEVPVVVHLAAPAHLAGDALAGWEIGAATAALLAGAATVTGIEPARLARVRTVVDHLQAGAPEPSRGAPAPDREAVR
jgi:hypothetical protein